jgi:5-methylcytosine-specific restriction endonuclease McrA
VSWVRFDDASEGHPKFLRAGLAAEGLHKRACCYASKQLTDGFVPQVWVDQNTWDLKPAERRRIVAALVTERLFEPVEGGYMIHDFLDFNPSRAQVEERQVEQHAVKSAAGKAGAEKRWRKERTSQKMRAHVAEKLGAAPGDVLEARCAYCPATLTVDWSGSHPRFLDANGKPTPELDHAEPLALGGPHSGSNLVLSCLACNRQKGAKAIAPASSAATSLPGASHAGANATAMAADGPDPLSPSFQEGKNIPRDDVPARDVLHQLPKIKGVA